MKAKTHYKYDKPWNKIRNIIRSKIDNSVNYDEEYMKIRFNADADLSLKKRCNFMKVKNITHKFP